MKNFIIAILSLIIIVRTELFDRFFCTLQLHYCLNQSKKYSKLGNTEKEKEYNRMFNTVMLYMATKGIKKLW